MIPSGEASPYPHPLPCQGFAWMGLSTHAPLSCIVTSHQPIQSQLHPKRCTGHSDSFLYLTLPNPRIEEPLPHFPPATAKRPWSRFSSSCLAGLFCRCSNHTRLHPAWPITDGHGSKHPKIPPGRRRPVRVLQPEQLEPRGQAKNRGTVRVSEDPAT